MKFSSDWVPPPQEKNNKDGDSDPPTFTEFLEYILHEDMTGGCARTRVVQLLSCARSIGHANKQASGDSCRIEKCKVEQMATRIPLDKSAVTSLAVEVEAKHVL